MTNNCFEFLYAKRYSLAAEVVNIVFGILLLVYKSESSTVKYLNVFHFATTTFIHVLMIFNPCCCCIKEKEKQNQNQVKTIDTQKEAKKTSEDVRRFIESINWEIEILKMLQDKEDEEMNRQFSTFKERYKERQMLYENIIKNNN